VPVGLTYVQIKDQISNMEIKLHMNMKIVLTIVSTAPVIVLVNVINVIKIMVTLKRTVNV